jgi:hypothetical protein
MRRHENGASFIQAYKESLILTFSARGSARAERDPWGSGRRVRSFAKSSLRISLKGPSGEGQAAMITRLAVLKPYRTASRA